MGKIIDISGKRYGRLTVVSFVGVKDHAAYWLCKCDCGNTLEVRGYSLRTGNTNSCGCLFREKSRERVLKTGESRTRLYNVWACMLQRCYNPKNDRYRWYGERGVEVCDEWMDFSSFKEWAITTGYDESATRGECTLDRINPFGNYEPSNCRWVSMDVQLRNKRNTTYSINL